MKSTHFLTSLFFAAACLAEGSSIDFNIGLSASKSILGFSYNQGRNQLNFGLRGFAYSSRDGFFAQPGIAYNRYLTENGFYASAIYVPSYRSRSSEGYLFNSATDTVEYRILKQKGWHPGLFMTGLGKSWQFTRWGLHTDAGVATKADSNFGKSWGIYFGGAVSYRFSLNN